MDEDGDGEKVSEGRDIGVRRAVRESSSSFFIACWLLKSSMAESGDGANKGRVDVDPLRRAANSAFKMVFCCWS